MWYVCQTLSTTFGLFTSHPRLSGLIQNMFLIIIQDIGQLNVLHAMLDQHLHMFLLVKWLHLCWRGGDAWKHGILWYYVIPVIPFTAFASTQQTLKGCVYRQRIATQRMNRNLQISHYDDCQWLNLEASVGWLGQMFRQMFRFWHANHAPKNFVKHPWFINWFKLNMTI